MWPSSSSYDLGLKLKSVVASNICGSLSFLPLMIWHYTLIYMGLYSYLQAQIVATAASSITYSSAWGTSPRNTIICMSQ